jgi:hypothetical protein
LRVKLGIEAQPWDGEGRDTVKRITNILFNSSSQHAIYKMKKKEVPALKMPLQWIVPSIVDFHSPIRGFFFKGMSPLMMAIESDICHRIIMKGVDDNVVILPTYDAFRTDIGNRDYLIDMMISSYRESLIFDPVFH